MRKRILGRGLLAGLLLFAMAGTAAAGALTTLHRFTGESDGDLPIGPLVADRQGNLYGTTVAGGKGGGGTGNGGTVYQLSPPAGGAGAWTHNVLHSFQGGTADGDTPFSGVIFGPSGALYGMISQGGLYNGGVAYELTPGVRWHYKPIFNTFGVPDNSTGKFPSRSLLAADGRLYGVTLEGGASNDGTLFSLQPTQGQFLWSETVLVAFDPARGSEPFASPVLGPDGALYGTTSEGVYRVSPAGEFSLLHRSSKSAGTPNPGIVFDDKGALYGVTANGGREFGTLYQLRPPAAGESEWAFTQLYTFCTGPRCLDGSSPEGGLVRDAAGALYGETTGGGAFDGGVVFKLTPGGKGSLKVLHSFAASGRPQPSVPNGDLLLDPATGNLYGTTAGGGYKNCLSGSFCGTVFQIAQ